MSVALPCLLAGCGDELIQVPPGGSSRLELAPRDNSVAGTGVVHAAAAPEITHVAYFEPVREPDEWEAIDAEQRHELVRTSVEEGQDVPGLAFHFRSSNKSIFRAGPLDASRINEVDLYMLADKPAYVTVELVDDGKIIATTNTSFYDSAYEAFHVVEPFLWPLPEKPDCDAVIVRIDGDATLLAVISIALNDRPPSTYAPADQTLESEFTYTDVTCPGRWLSTRRSLVAQTKVKSGSTLVFKYLQPRRTRRHGADAAIVVEAGAGAGEQPTLQRRYVLEGGGTDPSHWQRVTIPLEGVESGPVVISLSLEASADSAAFIANAAIIAPATKRPPSVLLVTSDTHRADFVGAAGMGVEIETPALDALIARGVFFSNCYAPTNSTNPSHTSLMTGVHTRDVAIPDNATPLLPLAPTLAESFRALGYRTLAVISAHHLAPSISGLGQGFDVFSEPPFPLDVRSAQETIDKALELLAESSDEAQFMWVHVFDAHAPYEPPAEFDRRYYPHPGRDPFDPNLPPLGIAKDKLAEELQGLGDLEFPRAQYKAEITYLDTQLARLFEAEPFANGVTAFLADHGESLGEHGIYFDHAGLFPQSVHIPLAIAWPGGPAGERVDARVMHCDLGRTLLALAGDERSWFPGRDLTAALADAPATERKATPRFLLSGTFSSAAIEDGEHYLILTLADPVDPRLDMQTEIHRAFLYDLRSDPACEHDVLDSQFEIAAGLRAQLVEWLEQRRSLGWAGGRLNDPAFLEQLSKLGYVSIDRPAEKPLWEPDDCAWCRRFE